MEKDLFVKELFKETYNLYVKYSKTDLSEIDVKEYLSEQKKITEKLTSDKVVFDMLEVVDQLLGLEVGE
jgi:hypothetical protein